MAGLIMLLKPALLTKDGTCLHQPRCPDALAPGRTAAWPVACCPEQGWSLLCNGVVLFDDGGPLLPDGRAEPSPRPPRVPRPPRRSRPLAVRKGRKDLRLELTVK
jgi:hypothetical protein